MMSFHLETEINKPIGDVIRLFSNRDLILKWQPGLMSSEWMEANPFPKYKLQLQFARRKMAMTETILNDKLPGHFEATYEMKGVINHVHYSFEAMTPGKTRWTGEIEFRFKGMMRLIAFFMKEDFRKQSAMIMRNFKNFAENYQEAGNRR